MLIKLRKKQNLLLSKYFRVAVVFVGILLFSATSHATVIQGKSEGYGLQIDLDFASQNLVDLLNGNPVGVDQLSQGIAPSPYNESKSAVFAGASGGVSLGPVTSLDVFDINTSVLNSSASSNVDGASGNRFADGMGEIQNASFGAGIFSALGITTFEFLGTNASVLQSTANVTGDYGSLSYTGNSVITDLGLILDGVAFNLGAIGGITVDASSGLVVGASPNTTILDVNGIAGLNLVLNEQILTGDGVNDLGVEVNALHLSFNAVDLGLLGASGLSGILSGDVIMGHSSAYLQTTPDVTVPIPEPTIVALMVMGLFGITLVRRSSEEV